MHYMYNKTARVPTRDGKKCGAIFRAVGMHRYNQERYGVG